MLTRDLAAAKQKAYRILSLRPHSERELKKKLKEKGFAPSVIEEALEKLRELKYLNDESFAFQWARNLAVNKLWGNRKIILSLWEKGIDGSFVNVAVENAREEISEEAAIESLIKKKKARKKTDLSDIKEQKKIFQSLMGRGFPSGLILSTLKKISHGEFDEEDR